jgi:hypothetical protein
LNLEGFGTLQSTTTGSGSAELFELSLDSPSALTSLQADSFTLASLTFTGLTDGTSALSLSVNAVGDQNGDPLSASLQNGSISVGTPVAVPEPSELGLMAGALACVALFRKRAARSAA